MVDPVITATLPAAQLAVGLDPRVAELEAQVATLTAVVAGLQGVPQPAPTPAPIPTQGTGIFNKILMLFTKTSPYHEIRWNDEKGLTRGQIVIHGWDGETPPQFHGHLSFYLWDPSDPSGNQRHHPLSIFYGVPDTAIDGPLNTIVACDPSGKPILPLKILKRFRSRLAFDHANIDFMDSEIYKRSTGGKVMRLVLHDDGTQQWVPSTTPPVPNPGDPWVAEL